MHPDDRDFGTRSERSQGVKFILVIKPHGFDVRSAG